ncbi:efflux RND transporter periplasmic adaptor subunit [Oleispirillum naphthae]|uniref:efflux RND transporter periplasmic adaptor subunit n=1 Tax=Oleispirillum naphthae TaxID=2838853 RepID=UPI0030826C15
MRSFVKAGALALGVVGVAVLGGCQDKAPQPRSAVEVGTVTLVPQRVEFFAELPGRTSAYRVAEVRPQVNGIVKKRLFEEGAEVEAGQQLYQIDPAKYEANLASARADLAKAEANVKTVEAKAKRYADLVAVHAVSKQDRDDVVASLAQYRAEVQAARAAVDLARIDLGYTRVYAPISGRIGRSAVTEGALVTAGQTTALATVTQLDPIYVDMTQSSDDMAKLRRAVESGQMQGKLGTGTRVSLSSSNGGYAYAETGTLQFSDVTVDQTTGTVTLRAIFPNPRHELLPGLFVRARVAQGVNPDALTVPQAALVRDAVGGANVWMAGTDGKAGLHPVKLAQANGDGWVVASGLKAGDKVIVDGLQRLRAGVPVKAVDLTQTAETAPPGDAAAR